MSVFAVSTASTAFIIASGLVVCKSSCRAFFIASAWAQSVEAFFAFVASCDFVASLAVRNRAIDAFIMDFLGSTWARGMFAGVLIQQIMWEASFAQFSFIGAFIAIVNSARLADLLAVFVFSRRTFFQANAVVEDIISQAA